MKYTHKGLPPPPSAPPTPPQPATSAGGPAYFHIGYRMLDIYSYNHIYIYTCIYPIATSRGNYIGPRRVAIG